MPKLALMLIGAFMLFAGVACGESAQGASNGVSEGIARTPVPGKTLTIGDISNKPIAKIELFKPLADHLALQLADLGYGAGRVVIAQSMDEMGALLESGEVDIFMDSAYPSLLVQQQSESRFLLRRWKGGDASYWSVFAAGEDTDIETLSDLIGQVIAAEDSYSTSGYALAISELINGGIPVQIVDHPDADVSADSVGIWFSTDEDNTLDAIQRGAVAAGVLSNQDLADFSVQSLTVIDRSGSVPRQIVSVSSEIPSDVADRIRVILMELSNNDEGLALLDHVNTARFDDIPEEDFDTLVEFSSAIKALP